MESHLSLHFPTDAAKPSEPEDYTARTMRLSTGRDQDFDLQEFSSENYQILRELIHDLQLKSAIDRQNLQKT